MYLSILNSSVNIIEKHYTVNCLFYNYVFIREDFEISCGPEEAYISVFQLLADACEHMMNFSSQVKRSDLVVVASSLVYSRILWSKYM